MQKRLDEEADIHIDFGTIIPVGGQEVIVNNYIGEQPFNFILNHRFTGECTIRLKNID